jgi:hypothetical protein
VSNLKKRCFQAVQEIDNLNQVFYLQELTAMISEQLELSTRVQARRVWVDLLLDLYREQIVPELEELRSHLAATCSDLEFLLKQKS